MRLLNKMFVPSLILGCSLAAGWVVPTRLWYSDLDNSLSSSLGFFPGWSQRTGTPNGGLGSLSLSLDLNAHCGADGFHDEIEWLEREVAPSLIAAGESERKSPGYYQLREKLLLKTFDSYGTAVTGFGWAETPAYDEIYYVTPLSYAKIAKRFKQPINKSGENEVVVGKVIAPGGALVHQTLRLTKTNQGTRVACREFKNVKP